MNRQNLFPSIRNKCSLLSEKLKNSLIKDPLSPIFVVGTGRSGTHFLARTLVSHPDINDLTGGEENPYVFNNVVDLAQNDEFKPEQFNALMKKYHFLKNDAKPARLLDQSHPNLWHVEKILNVFPQAKFVAIVRDPASVAFSTLNHAGVRGWLNNWERIQQARKFFGIANINKKSYQKFSIVEKSTYRWCSHVNEINRLSKKHPKNFKYVPYEELCRVPKTILAELSIFLKINNKFVEPVIKTKSLAKKDNLTNNQLTEIKEVAKERLDLTAYSNELKVIVNRYIQ